MDADADPKHSELSALLSEAHALLEATAGVAGETITQARKRLAAALEVGKKSVDHMKDKAVAGAKATDEMVHRHPYQAIGIALGVGALVGFLCSRRCCHRHE